MSDTYFDSPKPPSRPPNCLKCAYFKVVYDPRFHGNAARECEIFSIRTSEFPSQAVSRATKAHCPSFKLKEGLR